MRSVFIVFLNFLFRFYVILKVAELLNIQAGERKETGSHKLENLTDSIAVTLYSYLFIFALVQKNILSLLTIC